MGVDKANVRSVVHFDLPPNVESFLQESGRGGRDGAPATSVVLWNQGDARDALATERGAIIWRYLQETQCRRAFLLSALGAESDSCFGCDSCEDANDRRGPVLETELGLERLADRAVTFVHRYRRLVGTAQLEDYLRTDCTEPERADAVEELILRGRIRRIRRGPWRSRLTDR
jgi:ATP-dependent DNA helicase RecQ